MWLKSFCLSLLVVFVLAQNDDIPDFDWDTETALDTYVHADDGEWRWSLEAEYNMNGVDVYVLNMTSQKWMDETYSVDCVYWWHWMIIAVPQGEVRYSDHATMFITAGTRNDDLPDEQNLYLTVAASLANDTGTIVSAITNVPFQPCKFQNDWKDDRSEDSLIAWTWRTGLDDPTKNPEQIARLPFTKAAKRGLDTVNAFVLTLDGQHDVQYFNVLGASKRGWTTWSLAATDRRVVVASPIVFSLLNAPETLQSHYRALGGGWSFAFEPYFNENLTYHLLDENIDWLYDLEDMLRYRSRLTMPKLLTLATGDEFFLNQDSHHWWEMMTEPMYMMMVPNAQHALFPHYPQIYETITSFWLNYLQGNQMPELRWNREQSEGEGGNIDLQVLHVDPVNVRGLYAETLYNDTDIRRDYRLRSGHPDQESHPVRWFPRPVTEQGNNYHFSVDEVEDKWVGHFIECEFEGPEGHAMYLTTEVNIVPDTFPVEPCTTSEECYGFLT